MISGLLDVPNEARKLSILMAVGGKGDVVDCNDEDKDEDEAV